MTTLILPTPPSTLGFSVFKTPQFQTRIQKAVSGRELRVLYKPVPTWLFKLRYDILHDGQDQRASVDIRQELRTLMGFYGAMQGSFTQFFFDDPTDDSVVSQPIGFGNGSQLNFQLVRTMPNGFSEPIIAPNSVENVYVNGILQRPGIDYTVNYGTGMVNFITTPTTSLITADFSYYFLVRFADDNLEFENFMAGRWQVPELKLQSVLL